ncbi:MAG: DUF2333 family protein [Pedobacter sp.]|nr:DUF2333 family protein [Pedobacter sp.]
MDSWYDSLGRRWQDLRERWGLNEQGLLLPALFLLFLLSQLFLAWSWSREPRPFAVSAGQPAPVPGVVLARTLADVSATLTEKKGGYLRNDLLPPGVVLDNMSSWELGALHQVRDMTRVMHRDLGLSPRLVEDADLADADDAFSNDENAWAFPSTESELRRGTASLRSYAARLGTGRDARFLVRDVYLVQWLSAVEGELDGLSSRLNASLPDHPVLTGRQSMTLPPLQQTSWWRVDNVFYEARGSAWALMHLLKAVEIDFGPELARRQALLSLRAAIHELEATQQTVWSPVILNGSGFGVFANHSLVMANYLNRARTDLADVRMLLQSASSEN